MVGGVATTFAFLRIAGGFGESVQAAYAIGLRLGMIAPMVCFPLAGACATIVGQALGAGDANRAWRAMGTGLAVHATIMFFFSAAFMFFRVDILEFFSSDPEVIRIGSEYLWWLSLSVLLWAFYFVFMRSLQGAGDFVVPMALSLGTAFLVTLPLAWLLTHHTDLAETGIWIAQLVSSGVLTISTGIWVATGRWARRAAHSVAE